MKISSNGYWTDETGKLFIPVGVNYWPSSTGVEMWAKWNEQEILGDLDLVVSLGFNTIRFFLRWQDFEPQEGCYDEVVFGRLKTILDACRERNLHAQPCFIVGWMSGGTFYPEWKGDRNLFSDPVISQRAFTFAGKVASFLKPYEKELAGVDLGNELDALAESSNCSPKSIRAWCKGMTDAIREQLPHIVILSGCDHQQVIRDTGWRFGDQPGIDVYTMHGYPVPGWHPVLSGGLRDKLTQSLLPFYVKCARQFAPVMLQEFGTILTRHAGYTDEYLRAMLPACWNAGANGFLWWCLKDIVAPIHPYTKNHFESELGLVDKNGKVKEGLKYFVQFANDLIAKNSLPTPEACDVHLYFPLHYYDRENPLNPGNVPLEMSRRMITAHHLLEQSGKKVGIVRGGIPIPSEVKSILITSAFPELSEVHNLEVWIKNGGRLIWHAPDPFNWAEDAGRLIGAEISDYLAAVPLETEFERGTRTFRFYPRDTRIEAKPTGAEVLHWDDKGNPFVLSHKVGKGRVITVLADVELQILSQWSEDPFEEAFDWYAKIFGYSCE